MKILLVEQHVPYVGLKSIRVGIVVDEAKASLLIECLQNPSECVVTVDSVIMIALV